MIHLRTPSAANYLRRAALGDPTPASLKGLQFTTITIDRIVKDPPTDATGRCGWPPEEGGKVAPAVNNRLLV